MRTFVTFLFLFISTWSLLGQSHLKTLQTPQDFEKLSAPPLVEKYGQVSAVKLIFDLDSETLYFINAKNYKLYVRLMSTCCNACYY